MANNCFTLFHCGISNSAASADDILQIFPYLLVKAEIPRLLHHLKFLKLFQHKFCEESYVLNKITICLQIISQMKVSDEQIKNNMQMEFDKLFE